MPRWAASETLERPASGRYDTPTSYVVGQRLYPKNGGMIDNFPQQNYDNGVTKNTQTSQRYKKVVRCIKKLEAEMYEQQLIPRDYPRLPDRVPRLQRAERSCSESRR